MAKAAGIAPADACPVQVQSSQSRVSAVVPLAKPASSTGTFRSVPQTVASGVPPFLRTISTAFCAVGTFMLAMATAMVCSVIFLACSMTSAGRSSYFSSEAYFPNKRVYCIVISPFMVFYLVFNISRISRTGFHPQGVLFAGGYAAKQ